MGKGEPFSCLRFTGEQLRLSLGCDNLCLPLLSKSDELIKLFPSFYFAALSLLNRAARLPNSMWLHARYGVGAIKLLAPSTEA